MERDVVIVGSGAAAMTAAITAAHAGLDVLLVEKASDLGGTSALSGGVAWIPDNPRLDEISRHSGERDSAARAMTYFESLVGRDRMRPQLMQAFFDHGREMVEFLERETLVRFDATTYPDYKAHLPGGMPIGRSISAAPFDGAQLGAWFPRLKRPMPELCVLGSMMVDGADIQHLMQMGRSLRSFAHSAGRFVTFLGDRLRHGRGARLVMGNALIGRLLKSALDLGVTIWTDSPATGISLHDGRVAAVTVRRGDQEIPIRVRRGVVLATGGFAHDDALTRQLIPHPDQHQTLCPETNSGDGIHMGLDAGGRMGGNTWQNFLGTQVTMMHDRQGRLVSKIPFLRRDRNKPGFVLVDRTGRRFVNEAWPYNDVAHAMNANPDAVPSFLICDHERLRRYGLGLVRPGPGWARPLRRYLRWGHLVRANSIPELAGKLGIDAERLSRTVADLNDYARTGLDLEFGKGETPYDRWQGDPAVNPNPCLGPIHRPPYYAVTLWPGNLGTFCGLETDAHARVIDRHGEPIAGLYAAGCDMHPVFSGAYPGGGGSIGPGMTFGYIAGRSLADSGEDGKDERHEP